MNKQALIFITTLGLVGCGSTNAMLADETQTIEQYYIFDIQTTASKATVFEAAESGLKRHVNDARTNRPLQMGATIPETPNRFSLSDPLAGNPMAAMAASQGVSMKFADCTNGAVWIGSAERRVESQNMRMTACLYPYTKGYHLNFYMVNQIKKGSMLGSMVSAVRGSPEKVAEEAVLEMVAEIEKKAGATIAFVEGQPELQGQPWKQAE